RVVQDFSPADTVHLKGRTTFLNLHWLPFTKGAIRIKDCHVTALLAMTSEMKADLKVCTTVEPESFKK
ncbi:MAG TPA: hypothetical protein VF343_03290, partial [Syntrophales bacterium]